MPQALEKRRRSAVASVTVRYSGDVNPSPVVPAREMARETEQVARVHQMVSEPISLDPWFVQSLLALKKGTTVIVPEYSHTLWWFVEDGNGPAQTITTDTLFFECRSECMFPCAMVQALLVDDPEAALETVIALSNLKQAPARAKAAAPCLKLAA